MLLSLTSYLCSFDNPMILCVSQNWGSALAQRSVTGSIQEKEAKCLGLSPICPCLLTPDLPWWQMMSEISGEDLLADRVAVWKIGSLGRQVEGIELKTCSCTLGKAR